MRRWKIGSDMRKRTGIVMGLVACAVGIAASIPYLWINGVIPGSQATDWTGGSSPPASPHTTRLAAPPAAAAPAKPQPLLHPAPVAVNNKDFWSWALMDRSTGQITASSANAQVTNVTASMIKAWLAADFLRRSAEKNKEPSSSDMKELTIMIRDSDNNAASYFARLNGYTGSIARLKSMCGLTDSKAGSDWANTFVSARDSTRMGACIGDGRAAGAKWTSWLLNEMRSVRGVGKFGIIKGLPADIASQTAIKNGWVVKSDGKWHINCMAIGPDWVLSVMTVYPSSKGMDVGMDTCSSVAQQLQAKT
jgi:hypothetical protein